MRSKLFVGRGVIVKATAVSQQTVTRRVPTQAELISRMARPVARTTTPDFAAANYRNHLIAQGLIKPVAAA